MSTRERYQRLERELTVARAQVAAQCDACLKAWDAIQGWLQTITTDNHTLKAGTHQILREVATASEVVARRHDAEVAATALKEAANWILTNLEGPGLPRDFAGTLRRLAAEKRKEAGI